MRAQMASNGSGRKKAAHVVFMGRVQGVFFRANTQEKAIEHGLGGWVRNREDGSVEAFFEGDESEVRAVIEEIARGDGMGAALVSDKRVRWVSPEGCSAFDVLR